MPKNIEVKVTAKVIENDKLLIKRITQAISKELSAAATKALGGLQTKIEEMVYFWVEQQPEIESLQGGLLQGDFGIPSGQEREIVQEILYAVSQSIELRFGGFDKNLKGKLLIHVQPNSFENVLSVAQPVVTRKGTLIPWLKWLLFSGDSVMVLNYHVEYLSGPEAARSRSGTGAVMQSGDVFRVRPEFSGTRDNNFITRAFADKDKQLGRLLEEHISAKMGRG